MREDSHRRPRRRRSGQPELEHLKIVTGVEGCPGRVVNREAPSAQNVQDRGAQSFFASFVAHFLEVTVAPTLEEIAQRDFVGRTRS